MKKLKNRYTVITTEDYTEKYPNDNQICFNIPKGSSILIGYVSKYKLKGLWGSSFGTFQVTVPKNITKIGRIF